MRQRFRKVYLNETIDKKMGKNAKTRTPGSGLKAMPGGRNGPIYLPAMDLLYQIPEFLIRNVGGILFIKD